MREAYLTGGLAPETTAPPADDRNLTKVKINRKDSTLYAEYSEGEAGGYAEKTALHHRPVHADLEAAFARVLPHFLLLLEMLPGVQQGEQWLKNDSREFVWLLEDGELAQLPECQAYKVTGYAYSDKGGVVLLGSTAPPLPPLNSLFFNCLPHVQIYCQQLRAAQNPSAAAGRHQQQPGGADSGKLPL